MARDIAVLLHSPRFTFTKTSLRLAKNEIKMSGWIMPLRRGKKKVQSNHLVVSGTEMVALRKVRQYGQMLTRNRPVMKTIFTVTLFSVLQYGNKKFRKL